MVFIIWNRGMEKINMAIIIDDQYRIFTLQTKNSTYQIRADAQNVLLHTYYGEKRITATNLFCSIELIEAFRVILMKWESETEHILWIPFRRNIAALEQVTIE